MKAHPSTGVDDLRRTQIYLSVRQQQRLDALALRCERSKSHLIREAIDRLLQAEDEGADAVQARRRRLQRLAGAWADKSAEELADLRGLRDGWSARPSP